MTRWHYFFVLEDVCWRRWRRKAVWRDFVDFDDRHLQYWTIFGGPFVWLVGRERS